MHAFSSGNHGRLRFRNPLLRDGDFGIKMVDHLKSVHGVLEVKLNPYVGSLLVVFDRAKTHGTEIIDRISEKTGVDCRRWLKKGSRFFNNRRARQLVKLGMIAGAGGTLGALSVSKKMHIAAGTFFMGAVALHVIQNRKTLLK